MIILILFYRIGNKLSHLCTLLLENMGPEGFNRKTFRIERQSYIKVREAKYICAYSLAFESCQETSTYSGTSVYLLCHNGRFIRISSFKAHLSKIQKTSHQDRFELLARPSGFHYSLHKAEHLERALYFFPYETMIAQNIAMYVYRILLSSLQQLLAT